MGILDGYYDPNQPYTGGILGGYVPSDPQTFNSGWAGMLARGPGFDLAAQAPAGVSRAPTEASSTDRSGPNGVTLAQAGDRGFGRGPGRSPPFASVSSGFGALFGGAPPAPAATPQPGGPGFGDRLTAAVANFAGAHALLPALSGALTGATTGQRTDPAGLALAQQHATMQALMRAGIDPVIARAAAANPDYLKALVAARYRAGPAPQPAPPVARAGADGSAAAQPPPPQQIGGNATQPPLHPTPNAASRADSPRPLLRVATPTEAGRLPSGTHFIDPRGVERVVP